MFGYFTFPSKAPEHCSEVLGGNARPGPCEKRLTGDMFPYDLFSSLILKSRLTGSEAIGYFSTKEKTPPHQFSRQARSQVPSLGAQHIRAVTPPVTSRLKKKHRGTFSL